MTVAIGTLAPFAPPVICDFGWDSGLPGYTYTANAVTYPPTPVLYSATVNYINGADIFYSGSEYVCVAPNGPATSVVTPGTNSAVWEIFPYRDFYYQTPLQTVVTFDAVDSESLNLPKVYTPPGVSIVSYQWNFGNGLIGYGPTALTTYTYNQGPPDIQCMLTVVDSLGRLYSCAHYLELAFTAPSFGFGGYFIGSTIALHTYNFSVTDTLHPSDTVARVFHGHRTPADVIAIAEAVTHHDTEHRSVTDTLTLIDVLTHTP